MPESAGTGIIKDEKIVLRKKDIEHSSRRIAYWDDNKGKLYIYLTNNFDYTAE